MTNLLASAIRRVVVLDSIELDKIVSQHYGVDYKVQQVVYEASQGSIHSVELFETRKDLETSWKLWYGESAEEKIRDWLDGTGKDPHPSVVLSDLYIKGLIPKENYEIYVWW